MSNSSINSTNTANTYKTQKNEEDSWLKVQREIEIDATLKAEEAQKIRNAGSKTKSLYEILEANKAAKQDAFEEATRLRNQFRALDEDEVDFLDSVLERTKAQEARVRNETLEGLQSFRRQQAMVDEITRAESNGYGLLLADDTAEGESSWAVSLLESRKRKRDQRKKNDAKVKIQKISTTEQEKLVSSQTNVLKKETNSSSDIKKISNRKNPSASPVSKSTLVNYGSDSDDW